MSTNKIQILGSIVSPSDWDATEGNTQILNKPTKLSQFEGEMTENEQAALRAKIGAEALSNTEIEEILNNFV